MINILKKLKSIVPTDSPRNYGSVVRVTEEFLEYTDGFSLIRLVNTSKVPVGLYTKETLNQYIVAQVEPKVSLVKYPNTEAVVPKSDVIHTIRLDGVILEKCLKVLNAGGDKTKALCIEFRGEHDPIVFTNSGDDFALLVPIRKE